MLDKFDHFLRIMEESYGHLTKDTPLTTHIVLEIGHKAEMAWNDQMSEIAHEQELYEQFWDEFTRPKYILNDLNKPTP